MPNKHTHTVINNLKWQEAKRLAEARLPADDPLRDVIVTGAGIGQVLEHGQKLAQAATRASDPRHLTDLFEVYVANVENLDSL